MKFLIGDCRTIIENGEIFGDATEMAQAIENSEIITLQTFRAGVSPEFECQHPVNNQWTFGCVHSLTWAYDPEADVHYFFHS
jgi:hypothetical protein